MPDDLGSRKQAIVLSEERSRGRTRWYGLLWIIFVILGIVTGVYQIRHAADGNDFPKIRVSRLIGRYHLQVGTIPADIQAGHGHLAIDVRTADLLPGQSNAVRWRLGAGPRGPLRERAVTDARVSFSAIGPDGVRVGPVPAQNSASDPEYYDAPLNLAPPGSWRVAVAIKSKLGDVHLNIPLVVHPDVLAWGVIWDWTLWLLVPFASLLFSVYEERRRREH